MKSSASNCLAAHMASGASLVLADSRTLLKVISNFSSYPRCWSDSWRWVLVLRWGCTGNIKPAENSSIFMSAWVICSSFRVTHAFVKTFAVPLRPNLGVSPVFSKSVAFTLPYVDKEKKAKNIVLLYASIMYKLCPTLSLFRRCRSFFYLVLLIYEFYWTVIIKIICGCSV